MIPNDDKISTYQLGVFIFNIILGVGILGFPGGLAKAVENDAWILSIVAGCTTFPFIFLMCRIGIKYGELGFVGTLRKLFGNILGTILAIPAYLYFVVFGALAVRIFAETIKLYLLNNTPLEFVILPLILLCVFLARSGIEPSARFFEAVTPIIIFVMAYLILVTLPKNDYSNLRPYLSHPVSQYITGLTSGAFAYSGFEVLLIIFPFLRKPKDAFKAAAVSITSTIVLYTVITVLALAKFGAKETASLLYPTVTLVRASEVPGGFIERQEGVLLAIWVIFVFTTVVGMIYSSSVIAGDILGQRKRTHAVSLIIPLIYIIGLFGENIAVLGQLSTKLTLIFGSYTIIFLPVIMTIMSAIRGKKE